MVATLRRLGAERRTLVQSFDAEAPASLKASAASSATIRFW